MRGHSGPGPWPRPCGRSADTPRSDRRPSAHGRPRCLWRYPVPPPAATAAGPRPRDPARVYAYPKGAATVGTRSGCSRSDTLPGRVRAPGWPGTGLPLRRYRLPSARISLGQAEGVIARLGQPHRFFSPARFPRRMLPDRLRHETNQVRDITAGRPVMPKRSWVRLTFEGGHIPAEAIHRSTIVAQGVVGCAHEEGSP